MPLHLMREMERLKKKVLSVGAMVEEQVSKAMSALEERNETLARQVIEADAEIDRAEVEVEEECLKILALHQPVANDLRFVVSVLKMNEDLERMGDLAANIAKRAASLSRLPAASIPFDFRRMADKAQGMLKECLDALVNFDAQLARRVCREDEELDAMRTEANARVSEQTARHPESAEALLMLGAVARHLERLGDMATSVAEDVIYMVEGEIIRHRGED